MLSLVRSDCGPTFYDPSYGLTYTSEADFEQKAIAGYAMRIGADAPNPGIYHFAKAALSNITFLLLLSSSF